MIWRIADLRFESDLIGRNKYNSHKDTETLRFTKDLSLKVFFSGTLRLSALVAINSLSEQTENWIYENVGM